VPVAQPAAEPRDVVRGELRKLAHDMSHYFTGIIASLILGFISFPMFTRAFSVSDYGAIDLVQKVLLVVAGIAKLGLQNSALRFYDAKQFAANPNARSRYYSTLFFGTLFPAVAAMGLFGAIVVALPAADAAGRSLTTALLVAALVVPARSLQSIFWSVMRVEERTKLYTGVSVAMKAMIILAICALLRWHGASAAIYFGATTGVETAVVIGLTISLLRRGVLALSRFDRALFVTMFSFGMPLIVNEAAFYVLDAGDRVLVRHFLGGEALGHYSVAYGLASMVQNLLFTPLNLAVLPLCLRFWAAGEREKTVRFLSSGLDLLLMAGAGLFVLIAASAREIVVLSASAKYAGADELLPPIFGGLLLFTAYAFVSAGLMIEKKTGSIAWVMVASAAVNLVLNAVLLPTVGLYGAAVATLLSYAFCTVLIAYVSFKALPLRIYWKRTAVYAAGAAVAWGAAATIHTASPIEGAFLKTVVCICAYTTVLSLLDSRIRGWAGRLWRLTPSAQ
jgi:O-antigen/teichoic acid export membrane protein